MVHPDTRQTRIIGRLGALRAAPDAALVHLSALIATLRGTDDAARAMRVFTIATLLPVVLLIIGITGGVLAALALLGVTLVVWFLDRFIARTAPHVPGAEEFPAADGLLVLLALVQLVLLPGMVWVIAQGWWLSGWAALALFLGASLWVGQVANPAAHELIHRRDPFLHGLGVAVYAVIGYGHHASAHRLVHHRFVATPDDPNSARRGEHFWDFLLRAWPGEFVAGYEMESMLRQRIRRERVHPYVWYLGGTVLTAAAILAVAGVTGFLVWLGICVHAQVQMLLSDYVQHYGLERARREDGRLEPAGPRHSWDAPHWASSAMMLNAPRHADHHAHPGRGFPALNLPDDGLRLPYSLPFMAVLALIPPVWFRVMNRRLPLRAPVRL